jgi:hypothetical protein
MKPYQWILALLALTGIVFVVTLIQNFAPGSATPKPAEQAPSKNAATALVMDDKFPKQGDRIEDAPPPPHAAEVARPGYHDFWFRNDGDKELTVGLNSVSCSSCTDVELLLMPPAWTARWTKQHPSDRNPSSGGDAELQKLEDEAKPIKLEKDKTEVKIPPGAVGKARMHWSHKELGPKLLRAWLWVDQRDQLREMELRLYFVDALRTMDVGRDVEVGLLSPSQLPYSIWLEVWSSTRTTLDLRAKMAHPSGLFGSDAVQTGEPVKLDEESRKALARKVADANIFGDVLTAYKVPVVIGAQNSKKTQMEIGTFRRSVELSIGGDEASKKEVAVSGGVQGAVIAENSGRIDFKSVRRSQGDARTMTLSTDVAGLELRVDHVPLFLNAQLDKPTVEKLGDGGERRTWKLHVELPRNGVASGSFPRSDTETYRDSAVYLRLERDKAAKDEPKELLRISVQGVVSDG